MPRVLDRFDWIVSGVLLTLLALIGLLLLRGDQVGVRVEPLTPAPDAVGVSTRSEIRLRFGAAMAPGEVEARFALEPPVSGAGRWQGDVFVWRPDQALAADVRYTARLRSGARSRRGHTVRRELVWRFETGQARVLYVSSDKTPQIYSITTDGLQVRQLSRATHGVWGYAVSPDGSRIAYSVYRDDGSVDLRLMLADGSGDQLLLDCTGWRCTNADWSPDGRLLAFERQELNARIGDFDVGPGPPRIWLLEVGGPSGPLNGPSELGFEPRWSPVGERLGYFDPAAGVRVYDLRTEESLLIPSRLGQMGVWLPDGQSLVLVDLRLEGEGLGSHILRADLDADSIYDLSGADASVSDGSPASPALRAGASGSPDGAWIAFGRKALADGTPTMGQQLWLMRPDGSGAYPLVLDEGAHVGSLAWRPDGGALVYLRLRLGVPDLTPEVWLVEVDGGTPLLLARGATLPGWLP